MRSVKILIGALIAIPFFFILVIFCGSAASDTSEAIKNPVKADHASLGPEKASADTPKPVKTVVDPEEALRYERNQRELQRAVNLYFKKAIASGDIVGAGVSIVRGDSTVLSGGYGKRSSTGNAKVDGNTIFRLGSLSKGFAGILAADLETEGKLNWDDKVRDFIPDFRLGDLNNTDKITLAHILSHTSGAPYHSFTNLVDAGIPLAKIAKRFKEVEPISEPGDLYSYQNAMFSLCGEMMRKVTGKNIQKLLQLRIFNPLGMCNTTTDYGVLARSENVAMPHVRARRGWRTSPLTDSYHNAIAAGGINASASDMAKWMRFLLGNNPEIMDKAALAKAFDPQIAVNAGYKYYYRWPGHMRSYYGLGWRIHKYYDEGDLQNLKTIWHHGGSVNHFRNEIAVYPENNLGICVLLNGQSRLAHTVIPDLYAIVRTIYAKENNSTDWKGNGDLVSLE
ncbi:MAG TPA: serine hydrolase domain-containing protein [Pricia sp.]|nr:serine hydrolase domain-containing protein [Pricia sp.]